MNRQRLGTSALLTSRMAYGCMRIVGTWNPAEVTTARVEAGKAAILAAYESGYRLFDHADIYCAGECEKVHGELLKDIPSMRREIHIATKCGIRWDGGQHRYDFSREHIIASCDASLKKLNVEVIDLYQLHRPDYLMEPDEIATAFTRLHSAGKVRFFGVSNFSTSYVNLLQSRVSFSLAVNQVEVHLGRLDCFWDGTIDQCHQLKMTPLSWSPLGGGFLGTGGTVAADNPRAEGLTNLLKVLDETAANHNTDRTAISLAWLMHHPSGIIPIVGSAKPENIRASTKALDVKLSREDWYRIFIAAQMKALP